jgi:thioredoxin-like negative regulator of GroEL
MIQNLDIIILIIIIGIILAYNYYQTIQQFGNVNTYDLDNNKYTNDNQNEIFNNTQQKLTLFYSPNCGHCVDFLPEWKKIHNIESIKNIVVLETINCSENYNKCQENSIQAYPTIIMQKTDGTKIEYEGARTVESLINFINKINIK